MNKHSLFVSLFAVSLVVPGTAYARHSSNGSLISEPFEGHFRAAVKTHYSDAPVEACVPLSKMISSLTPDSAMRSKYPGIQDEYGPYASKRADEEKRNVCVVGNVYAIKFEHGRHGDNDFHMILGTIDSQKPVFMNVEISGLPASGDIKQFLRARQQLVALLGKRKLRRGYTPFRPPVKIQVTGSLYFDADHQPGQVGPAGYRPQTVWEIHPVSSITNF